jgi:hypothetical protein
MSWRRRESGVDERSAAAMPGTPDRGATSPGEPMPTTAESTGHRLRGSVPQAVAALVMAVLLIFVGLWVKSADLLGPQSASPPADRWVALPTPPLSPRTGGIAAWTGARAIFLGGEIDGHCPPNAFCTKPATYARDGASYDPATRAWSAIADAPVPVGSHTPHAVAGDVLVIVGEDQTWHAYDASEDVWQSLPAPPARTVLHSAALSAAKGSLAILGEAGAVFVLDLADETWASLPPSPHRPQLEAHSASATAEGIVVIGVDSTKRNDGTVPSYLMAEVYRDGAWRRAPRSDMIGGYVWHWTGERLVAPSTFCVDGGDTNTFPGCIPEGGIFDPQSGTWAPLPPAPKQVPAGWNLDAAAGASLLGVGYLYDDQDGSWTRVGAPDGYQNYTHVASVLADGRVIAFGGIDWSGDWDVDDQRTTNRAWTLAP